MPLDNGINTKLGEKEDTELKEHSESTLTAKPAKTYGSTIASPAPAFVFLFSVFFCHLTPINPFLLVVYSPSQPPYFCYPCSTSARVEFRPQISPLSWLCLRVASCNSLQACGNSREATCLELQVKKKQLLSYFLYVFSVKRKNYCLLTLRP
jgi:hypothetical protein